MNLHTYITGLLFFFVTFSLSAQEWSPYVPGQVSYFESKEHNRRGVRALDTFIDRGNQKVYYFRSNLKNNRKSEPNCKLIGYPDSMIFENGHYIYHVPNFELNFYFDDTVGHQWKVPDWIYSQSTDSFIYTIDSVKAGLTFGIADSLKYFTQGKSGGETIIISKKFGLIKGSLLLPYYPFDPWISGYYTGYPTMPDSLIGIKNDSIAIGEQAPHAFDFLPYEVGAKLLWEKTRVILSSGALRRTYYLDSIIQIDTTQEDLILRTIRIRLDNDGLDTLSGNLTIKIQRLNKMINNHMNYYFIYRGQEYKVGSQYYDGWFKYYLFDQDWTLTNCTLIPQAQGPKYPYHTAEFWPEVGLYNYSYCSPYTCNTTYLEGFESSNNTYGSLILPKSVGIKKWGITKNTTISIYPNPVAHQIKIEARELSEKIKYEIISVSGTANDKGYFTHQTTINVSHLPKGIYFIQLRTDDGQVVKKFVKQ